MTCVKRWLGLAAVVLLAGCGTAPSPSSPTGVSASRQSQGEVDETLASLRKVDDLPLYEMTYVGDYDPLAGVDGTPTASPFGCSLFAAAGDPDGPLFARNFDWDANPALVLHTDPPDGYASVSIVDVAYLGIEDPLAESDRRKLLNAPLLPFDGMNERGLAVGLAADESGRSARDPAKPTVGSVRILRLVLDSAATVDEALAVFGRYNVDFDGGPPLHYLIADASGGSAVVEFVDGAMRVERGDGSWQVLTNFRLAGADSGTRQGYRRYRVASEALSKAGGAMDAKAAMDVLEAVAQGHTRWSVTYGLRTGQMHVVTAKRWAVVHDFRLPPA